MATIEELLLLGKNKLEQSGNEYAKYERKVLLEEVLGMNYMHMIMNADQEVSKADEQRYMEYIERRCEHYPLQYLLGVAHFMDYTFKVNEHVLIPRNDTEILVETANQVLSLIKEKYHNNTNTIKVLDLCCGSGCIGISLKLYHNDISLFLSDYSNQALEVTKENLKKYALDANVMQGDLFENVTEAVDVIVSNPPYIERDVIDTLMPEVREFEPMMALDGGIDGLDFYRRIIKDSIEKLNLNGYLMFEIGYNQAELVSELMREQGFVDICVEKDYAGLDRVVYGHL